MKKRLLTGLIVAVLSPWALFAQEISITACYEKARELSPLAQNENYYRSITLLKEKNVRIGNLPDLTIRGTASYQSDVFQFPVQLPGFDAPLIPQEQYNLILSVKQNIYDGGMVRSSRQVVAQEEAVNLARNEVDLYRIRQVIDRLYFAALQLQVQEEVLKSVHDYLVERRKVIASRVRNGVLLPSAEYTIQKEVLKTEQQLMEAQLNKDAYLEMLGEWTGESLETATRLAVPMIALDKIDQEPKRPEFQLFEAQEQMLESSKQIHRARNIPKVFLFADAGVGSPNIYNWFDTDFSAFYKVGLGLQWNVFDWNHTQTEIEQKTLNQRVVNTNKQHMKRDIEINRKKMLADINTSRQLVEKDREILELQQRVVESASSQLENGVISTTDYIAEVNERTRVELGMKLHEIAGAKAYIDYLTISGNSHENE